jgi:hypothetical protein
MSGLSKSNRRVFVYETPSSFSTPVNAGLETTPFVVGSPIRLIPTCLVIKKRKEF